ncbi:MAG: T9SS type A sorting domain-containing protein [Chitinophagales bacterium]|nr:T9SS type A sorting domain-containing protein [Chitinophagales bacterium]
MNFSPFKYIAFILLFISAESSAQQCIHSFKWLNQTYQDTLNYTDSLQFSLKLHFFNAKGSCNTATNYTGPLNFNFTAYKELITNYTTCNGGNFLYQSAILGTNNPYLSTPISINKSDSTGTIVLNIGINDTATAYLVTQCGRNLVSITQQLAGEYIIKGCLTPSGQIIFGSSDTAIFPLYVNNPNCHPYFEVFPTANQGVYTGYNLSTGSNLKYFWDFGDGDTSNLAYPTHNYATPGKYYVCLMVTNTVTGCLDQFCDSSFIVAKTDGGPMSQLNILAPTSIAETKALESAISLFPNPATNQLTINANRTALESIRIYNLTSQLVLETKLLTNTIDISNLTSGIYIAEIKTKAGSVMKRWVKM